MRMFEDIPTLREYAICSTENSDHSCRYNRINKWSSLLAKRHHFEVGSQMDQKPEMASISKQELASHIAVQTDYELKDGRFAQFS